jgi:hypothetical protein
MPTQITVVYKYAEVHVQYAQLMLWHNTSQMCRPTSTPSLTSHIYTPQEANEWRDQCLKDHPWTDTEQSKRTCQRALQLVNTAITATTKCADKIISLITM